MLSTLGDRLHNPSELRRTIHQAKATAAEEAEGNWIHVHATA